LTVDCYPAGAVLVKAGEIPAGLYLIIEGAVYEVDGNPCAPGQDDAVPPSQPALWCVVSLYAAEDAFDARALLQGASKRIILSPMNRPAVFYCPGQPFCALCRAILRWRLSMTRRFPSGWRPCKTRATCRDLSAFTVTKIRDAYIHPPTFVTADRPRSTKPPWR
jgi:CBS domain-containing protein